MHFLGNNLELSVPAKRINKLSLVGMQLPEKYKANFDVSSEDPRFLCHFHYFVKSLFSLIYKFLILTLFDKIRTALKF
jgi:hypothetical protein